MEYKLLKPVTITSIPKNRVYTKAIYEYKTDNGSVTFTSNFISIIDIPYKRYKLIGGAYNESIICRRYS